MERERTDTELKSISNFCWRRPRRVARLECLMFMQIEVLMMMKWRQTGLLNYEVLITRTNNSIFRNILLQRRVTVTSPVPMLTTPYPAPEPRRFTSRFSVRPTPVTVRSASAHDRGVAAVIWREEILKIFYLKGSDRESLNRFPYIRWQNKEAVEQTKEVPLPSTIFSSKLFRSNENYKERNKIYESTLNAKRNDQENKNKEDVEENSSNFENVKNSSSFLKDVLENAVFADTEDYVKLYKNIKNRLANESLIDVSRPSPLPSLPLQVQRENSLKDKAPDQTTVKSTTSSNKSDLTSLDTTTRSTRSEVNILSWNSLAFLKEGVCHFTSYF